MPNGRNLRRDGGKALLGTWDRGTRDTSLRGMGFGSCHCALQALALIGVTLWLRHAVA